MTTLDHFREKATLWHPEKNAPLTPAHVTYGSKTRVWWRCPEGHEWQAAVYSVAADGCGCPWCAGRYPIPGRTDLATTHPDIARMWHEKNKKSPHQVTSGSSRKAWWRCSRGHEWEAMISSVAVDGCGCPYCAGRRAIPGETDLLTLRPDVAAQWDPDRNGSLHPSQVLPSAHDKVFWLCDLGHSYQAVVFSRTREKPTGCPYCTGRKALAGFNDLATLKPKLAAQWHPELNAPLTAQMVTLGSNKHIWWQCSDGHVWRAAVYSRTRRKGSGCPVCQGTVKEVKEVTLRRKSRRAERNRVESPNIQL